MNWIGKLERKFGKYAIHNLMFYIMILYGVGFVIMWVNPMFYYNYLSLDASMILKGQIWRVLTFIIYPPSTSLLYFVIAMFLYYSLGTTLEKVWGAFKFNLYFLIGIVGHVLAALIIYLVFGRIYLLGTAYLNYSLFFAFAATFPDMQFLLFFIIPVKAKWLGILYGVYFVFEFLTGSLATKICIVLAIANFLLFFLTDYFTAKGSPRQAKRRADFRRQAQPNPGGRNMPRHRCAICGRTEQDGYDLQFRYCSKCYGNYEYCQDHLYTHKHITPP